MDRWAAAELNGSQLVEAICGPVGSKSVLVYVRGNAAPVSATVTRALLGATRREWPKRGRDATLSGLEVYLGSHTQGSARRGCWAERCNPFKIGYP